jgi:hypothetical protein
MRVARQPDLTYYKPHEPIARLVAPGGYPGKLYIRGEAEQAVTDAQLIDQFCRRHVAE